MVAWRWVANAAGGLATWAFAQAVCAAPVDRLAWLAGCWAHIEGDRHVEEQWMAPRGGTLLGMGRTVAGGKAVAYEQMRIEEQGGHLAFIAKPSGQADATFLQTDLGDGFVAFANPGHDFPQRVRYRLLGGGRLLAQIEGERGGKTRTIDFPLQQVACAVER